MRTVTSPTATSPDVVVVGGGVIGLSVARAAARAGLRVTCLDPDPDRGAWRAAAGMLAPVTEAYFGEERLLGLALASAARYPDFLATVADESGQADLGVAEAGTLSVALDAGDRAALRRTFAYRASLGLPAQLLGGAACRELEPLLAPAVSGGVLAEGDRSVDPRRLVAALRAAAARAGCRLDAAEVAALDRAGERVTGVRLADGAVLAAGWVVLAAGCWSAALAPVPVRPVKGHILRLRGPAVLRHTVRATVAGSEVYLVPRPDGEVVVGATMEEMGFDVSVTAGGVYGLLRDAVAAVPGLAELELVECLAGLRPGSPDNAPMIGPVPGHPGLLAATGHHRNGVLLAPLTADAVVAMIGSGRPPAEVAGFGPDRFADAAA